MKTQRVQISSDSWTELAQGSDILLVQGANSEQFYIHFGNTADAPTDQEPFHIFQTWPSAFDFSNYDLVPGQRVWAKSKSGNAVLIVTRDVDVFLRFIPSGSDSLITANGNTFNVRET